MQTNTRGIHGAIDPLDCVHHTIMSLALQYDAVVGVLCCGLQISYAAPPPPFRNYGANV